ncbi:MAG: YgaP family membrane protein [Acidibrevibacterium sp.]|uniref:YgaP family membrane protein n=1 Tax=Acidibrevibacterium sp. TaxID=2606776 RepID=UPI003CFFECB8
MVANVGTADRVIRIVVGIALLAFAAFDRGEWRWVGLIGIVPIATALMGFCPLYSVLGMRTCPMTKDAK